MQNPKMMMMGCAFGQFVIMGQGQTCAVDKKGDPRSTRSHDKINFQDPGSIRSHDKTIWLGPGSTRSHDKIIGPGPGSTRSHGKRMW
jgi:hypothetical protein